MHRFCLLLMLLGCHDETNGGTYYSALNCPNGPTCGESFSGMPLWCFPGDPCIDPERAICEHSRPCDQRLRSYSPRPVGTSECPTFEGSCGQGDLCSAVHEQCLPTSPAHCADALTPSDIERRIAFCHDPTYFDR